MSNPCDLVRLKDGNTKSTLQWQDAERTTTFGLVMDFESTKKE